MDLNCLQLKRNGCDDATHHRMLTDTEFVEYLDHSGGRVDIQQRLLCHIWQL